MNEAECLREQLDAFRHNFGKLRDEINKVIVGHGDILDDTLTALIAGGHVLLEGVPGLGKLPGGRRFLGKPVRNRFLARKGRGKKILRRGKESGTNGTAGCGAEFTSRGGLRLSATIVAVGRGAGRPTRDRLRTAGA